jgi:hypothetical protein
MELALCGLDCAACPAYHAAERLTVEERQAVADKWTADFGGQFTAVDIDCVGCTVMEGPHPSYCAMCEIRACAAPRSIGTCAVCAEYGCAKLTDFLEHAPEAKSNLEALRN